MTRFIELFKNIRKNFINFLSIAIFIFLGTTLFQGLDYAGNAIVCSLDKSYKENNMYDVKLRVGGLLTQDDLNEIKNIDGVDKIEGYYITNDDFELDGKTYSCNITSITNEIATSYVVEGALPSNDNEIAINNKCAKEFGLKVGDKVTFKRKNTMFFIQSLVRDLSSFDINSYSEDDLYNFKNKTFTISALVMHGDFINHNDSAHGIDVSTGTNVKANFFVNYSAFNPSINASRFNGAYIVNNKINGSLYTNSKYKKEADSLRKTVNDYVTKNIDYSVDYSDAVENTIEDFAKLLLDEGIITAEQYANYETSVKDYAKNATEKEKIAAVTTKQQIVATIMFATIGNIFIAEKWACGGSFFVISLLICYSVISRLVSNDVKLIGTKKALGFKKSEVTRSYLGFSFIATLIGLILGNILSIALESAFVPIALFRTTTTLYFTSYFDPISTLILVGSSILLIGFITWLGCNATLKKKAITLLQGDIKVANNKENFIERSKLFKKASLINKTILRNFKNDLKRIFATVIGISSVVALLMASLTVKVVVTNSFDKQNKMFKYDTICFANKSTDNAMDNLQTYFEDNNLEYAPIFKETITFRIEGSTHFFGSMIVYFDNAKFNNLVTFEESEGNPQFENKGFWLPESYQKALNLKNTSHVDVTNMSGASYNFDSTGYFRYYSYNGLIYVDAETYKATVDENIQPNGYLVNRHEEEINSFTDKLSQVEGYNYTYDSIGKDKSDMKIFDSVSNIVFFLYGIATLLLSIFVVLNLFITNVKEKKRELITLMINGYSKKDAAKYIYVDTIFLTAISLVIGTFFGLGLAAFAQSSMESTLLYMIHGVNFLIIGVALLATIVLVAIMSIISLREINKFKLKDIAN